MECVHAECELNPMSACEEDWRDSEKKCIGVEQFSLHMLSLPRSPLTHHPINLLHYITTTYKFSSGSWRFRTGLHGSLLPETLIKDVYPWHPMQAPEAHDTPSIHSQFTITHTSSTFFPLPPHHWVPSLILTPTFPFLTSTATRPHLANLTSSSLSVSTSLYHLETVVHSRTIGKKIGLDVLQLGSCTVYLPRMK